MSGDQSFSLRPWVRDTYASLNLKGPIKDELILDFVSEPDPEERKFYDH